LSWNCSGRLSQKPFVADAQFGNGNTEQRSGTFEKLVSDVFAARWKAAPFLITPRLPDCGPASEANIQITPISVMTSS
jgi:hypothetical protein